MILWWIIISLWTNRSNASFFHKALAVVPTLKLVELIGHAAYQAGVCGEESNLEVLYLLLIYNEMYEASFFTMIYALSNGIILARPSFRGCEGAVFFVIAVGSFVLQLLYNEEMHLFNLPVFGVLSFFMLIGISRTLFCLRQ